MCCDGCGPSPSPGPAGPPSAVVHCPGEDLVEFHLHLDADRDGKVDADRTGLDKWHWGAGKKGAIILCNNDDDEGASASDNHDAKINKGNDRDEIAPLVIR